MAQDKIMNNLDLKMILALAQKAKPAISACLLFLSAWSPPNIQNKSTPSGPMSMPSNQQMSSNMVSRSYSWNDPYGNHGIYLGQYDRTQPPSYYHPGQNYWGYNSSYPNQNWGYDMHQSTNHTSMDKPEVTNTGSISNQNWSSNNTPQTYPSIDQSQEICGLPRASSQSWPPGSSQSTNRNGYEYSDQPTYTSLDKPQFSSNGHATHGYFTASHS
ncbi:hypothetical protein B566_EDAN010014 [Ephemera danica]|nr:hypothetical protein B566_EDAN010014 [Ephemera danica]